MVEMAGIGKDPGDPADGLSLVPLLRQRTRRFKRDTLYWHWPHYAISTARPASAIRRGDYKLIEFLEDKQRELYNLAEDAGEQHDLALKLPAKRDELRKALDDWRQGLHAATMRPNPNYEPRAGDRTY